jgi:hypothetical protein
MLPHFSFSAKPAGIFLLSMPNFLEFTNRQQRKLLSASPSGGRLLLGRPGAMASSHFLACAELVVR